ncbi:peptidase M76 family-domain-containing protein [Trametes polyzona]|nr:peptidase M76 family-domain-containing protein [Trametes polyzona]
MDASSSSPGPSTSDQSTFERWRRKFSLITGLGGTKEEREADMQAHHHKICEKWKGELMSYSPAVVFMMKHLKLNGCDVTPGDVVCAPCNYNRSGGFSPDTGVVILCQGKFMSKSHMEDTIVHELVHMYDHAKFKVDWHNLRHHACSEIRANSLSGDCKWSREVWRGFLSFSKQHQECVRRRAVLSVRANPACPDEAAAERAVNEVWESCFNDTRPFDEASVTQGPEGAGCLDERRIADVPPTDILELAYSLLIFAHALATDRP